MDNKIVTSMERFYKQTLGPEHAFLNQQRISVTESASQTHVTLHDAPKRFLILTIKNDTNFLK